MTEICEGYAVISKEEADRLRRDDEIRAKRLEMLTKELFEEQSKGERYSQAEKQKISIKFHERLKAMGVRL